MKYTWFLPALLVTASACGKVNSVSGDDVQPMSCTVACTADGDCPSGFTCGELGLCVQGSDTCSCTADEFIACDGTTAVSCNATANGVATEDCGAAGCNATAERCNDCVPSTTACSADSSALQDCSADGMVTQSTACSAGCVADASGDHCGHIQPAWLPDVCDADATTPLASLSGTLDTTMAASCSGGIVDVNGTMFCIVRASTITIADLKVSGANAIAFVADEALSVTGVLDVSADGASSGPGPGGNFYGSTIINGSYRGAGGGGFVTAGGNGGGHETGTPAGGTGGAMSDRPTTERFTGGARGGASICGNGLIACLNNVDFAGGGGGGGALLIACRGNVTVTGTIDAGGGGGAGGGDHETTTGTAQEQGGAGGGGSGGFVVFQGTQVSITGNLWANGGGGGGACGTDNCTGPAGSDALRSTTPAPGGDPPGNTGGGGVGASISTTNGAPGNGENTFSSAAAGAGGGGGSMGRFLVFTPAGVTPVLTPAAASPAPVASSTPLVVE